MSNTQYAMPDSDHQTYQDFEGFQDCQDFQDDEDTADADDFKFNFGGVWTSVTHRLRGLYTKASESIGDEFSLPVSQEQLNAALEKFVTENVDQILEIRMELHDGWFRLFCTIEAAGIYVEVASNFRLVHAQLDRNVQRFVFAQLTNTDVLKLRCESVLKRTGINLAIWFYHKILHKDPLGVILSYINIAKPKDNVIYLDIHRWLKKNQKIMTALHKAQVNYGVVEEEQLILKTKVNIRDLFSNSNNQDIITPDDEPELMDGPINPISDATSPSQE